MTNMDYGTNKLINKSETLNPQLGLWPSTGLPQVRTRGSSWARAFFRELPAVGMQNSLNQWLTMVISGQIVI